MIYLYNELLYRPLFNALVWIYSLAFSDLGVAIILITALVRVVLFPLFHKSLKDQRLLQKLQPEIKKIQANYKNNREKQTRAIMDFYKKNRVNPLTSFFLLLIQLPVLIALYHIFITGFSEGSFKILYSFTPRPIALNDSFLGLINLTSPNLPLTILAALCQYLQSKLSLSPASSPAGQGLTTAEKMGRQMVYIAPAITLIFLLQLPAAIGLYWLTTTIFSIIQQMIVNRLSRNERAPSTSQ